MKYPTTWVRDGALRDIYVFESNLREWQKVLDFVRDTYAFSYRVDDEETPLPASIEAIFRERGEHSFLLAVEAGNVNIQCHFFLANQIEFDVDPREIESEEDERAVAAFMRDLSKALGRAVVLTMEGAPDWVYLCITPDQDEPSYTPDEVVSSTQLSRDEALSMLAKQLGLDENDHEAVIERLIDSANKPHTAWRKPEQQQ